MVNVWSLLYLMSFLVQVTLVYQYWEIMGWQQRQETIYSLAVAGIVFIMMLRLYTLYSSL